MGRQSLIIEDISVHSFNDKKYLTTTKYTSVKQTNDTISIEPEHHESYDNVVASGIPVSISSYKSCLMCNTKIQIVDHNVATIKCHECKLTTFVNKLLDSSVIKLVLKDYLNQIQL